MRKYSWILALFVVLAMIFAACGDPPSGGGTVTCPGCGEPEAECSCVETGDFEPDLEDIDNNQLPGIDEPEITVDEDGHPVLHVTQSDQRISFTLSDAQHDWIEAALAAETRVVKVYIEIEATANAEVRFGFADPSAGSNWNGTALVTGNLTADTEETLTGLFTSATGNPFSAFTIQARNVAAAYDLVIKSIRFVIYCEICGEGNECECEYVPEVCDDCGEDPCVCPVFIPGEECEACGEIGCNCEVLFDFINNAHIQSRPLGTLSSGALWNDVAGLQAAGSPEFAMVANGDDYKGVRMSGSAGWMGVDLLNSTFDFQEGDFIFAVARIVSFTVSSGTPEILLNARPGAWGPVGANPIVTPGQVIELKRTLTATDVTNLKGSSPAAIRLQMNNVSPYVIEIYQLKIIRENDMEIIDFDVDTTHVRKTYKKGDSFDRTGMVITATYEDESEGPISITSPRVSFSHGVFNEEGEIEVKVFYNHDEIASFMVNVIFVVDISIDIENLAKTVYKKGESFDPTGMVINAVFNDESEDPIPLDDPLLSFIPATFTAAGSIEVTVIYDEEEYASFNVTVIEIVDFEIDSDDVLKVYDIGQSFNPAGIAVNAIYSDESEEPIDIEDLTFSHGVLNTKGQVEVKVFYNDEEIGSITVTVEQVLESISIETNPTRSSYFEGRAEAIDLAGIEVEATYRGGFKAELDAEAITGLVIEGFSFNAAGVQTITVSYTEGEGDDAITESDDFEVTVHALAGISVVPISTGFPIGAGTEELLTERLNNIIVTASYEGNAFTNPIHSTLYTLHNSGGAAFNVSMVNFDEEGNFPITIRYLASSGTLKTTVFTVIIANNQNITFGIGVNDIIEKAEEIIGVNLRWTGTQSETYTVIGEYDSVKWFIDELDRMEEDEITVSVTDFDTLGKKIMSLEVIVGGKTYNRTITFTVEL
ncbi:MAG: bacterial Ig-like domain-containing protein [Treponema sp.]|nr:bacterial Ig-like domain-containing protein [Treponema sp.]